MISPDSPALAERRVIVWVARAISYLVYFYLIVVEIILLIGFFLLLFGANPSAGFTQWAYRNLDRVMDPFRGIFTPIELGTTNADVQAVFDTSVLFAMIIYGIVALLLSGLIGWLSNRLQQIEGAEEYKRRKAELDAQQAELDAARSAAGTAVPSPGYVPPASPVPGTEPGIATPPPANADG
jgi:hypothetical protein